MPRTQQAVRRRMSAILKMEAEEKRIAVCFEYKMQTNWMSWDRLSAHEKKDITWHKMLHVYSESLLKFTLNAITNTLPSPDNLRRWGLATNCTCGLCNRPRVTLNHVLAGCPWVRDQENRLSTEDRFTWRHNCVLFHLAASIAEFVTKINTLPVSDAPTRRK